jgi:hypothetical protein
MQDIKENGGLDSLWLAFYASEDIGNDGVWDVWRLEGPAMVWYFRGSPHVHTWVRVNAEAPAASGLELRRQFARVPRGG